MVEEEFEDFRHLFKANIDFGSYKEARDWVYEIGHKHYMYFSVTSSFANRAYIGCERKGRYEDPKRDENEESLTKRRRKSKGTKKCGCKFQVNLNEKNGRWRVSIDPNRGRHNHPLGKYGSWHPSYVKLKAAQTEEIENLTDSNMKPQEILNRLQPKNPGMNLRQINNARVKKKKKESEENNSIELLMKNLTMKNYSKWDREVPGTKRLKDIVFANPKSIQLLRKFPHLLILDGTYSTNKHKMPLIEVIGAAPTGIISTLLLLLLVAK